MSAAANKKLKDRNEHLERVFQAAIVQEGEMTKRIRSLEDDLDTSLKAHENSIEKLTRLNKKLMDRNLFERIINKPVSFKEINIPEPKPVLPTEKLT